MTVALSNNCPLCFSGELNAFYKDARRLYVDCAHCQLIHVPEKYHLSIEREKAEYDLHENNPVDPGYRQFLGRVVNPLRAFLMPDMKGLDFGCGPGPTISIMMAEWGFRLDDYDPLYFPEICLADKKHAYDFVISTEVVEHLRKPRSTIEGMLKILKPDGLLAIMTKQALTVERFANWHYKNDMTHICFWRRETFEWLANRFSLRILYASDEVVILRK